MTIKEITELRKSGELEKAYAESKKFCKENPEDGFGVKLMAQSLKALMERAAKAGDDDALCALMEEYGVLGLEDTDEPELNNKVAWDVRALLLKWKEDGIYDPERIRRVCEHVTDIEFVRPHRYYSVLLEAFVRIKDRDGNHWPGLAEFVEWWGLENLLPEDYQKVRIATGQMIPSLAERTYTAYVKALLAGLAEGRLVKEAESFVYELDLLAESHPEFQYTLYHKTLLLKMLGRPAEAVAAAREFVKRRQNDFWAWSMIGDIVDGDDLKLSFYCRALLCRANPMFLIKVRQRAAQLMIARGDLPSARYELDEVISVSNSKGWRIPDNVVEQTRQQWYACTQPMYNNVKYYYSHLGLSEDFLIGDVPEKALIIVKYNAQKQTCSFITEDRQRGYFSTRRMQERFADNQIYIARFPEGVEEKLPTKVLNLRRVNDASAYEGVLFRHQKAVLNIRAGQSFTFIDDIYVDASLLPTGVRAGDTIEITAVIYYNIKHSTWGWRAVRVTQG